DTENEDVRLMMYPLSLMGEVKTWLDELNKGTIKTWDELRTAFISRFFPPALFNRLLGESRAFSQHENESLTDAWLCMKEMLRNCHGHNLSKGNIIKIFYPSLNVITQEVLNAAAGADLSDSINLMPYSLYAKLSIKTLKPTKMSVRLANRSFKYPVGIAKNMLIEVGKITFPADFVILEMDEDSKVPLIFGRPLLHITYAKKILTLFLTKEAKSSIPIVLEEEIFFEFDKFIAMTADENYDSESDIKGPPFDKIIINTDYKIKTSLEEPLTDLELKPLPDNLEYVFLEEPSFLPLIISS
nr:hypothetical protein [Tanacetum cinerariifolium]